MQKKIIEIFGKENVLFNKDELIIYGDVKFICFPYNIEQIFKIVRLANKYNLKIFSRGGGSYKKEITSDIVLDFAKFNHILDTNINDKNVMVQSGVVINHLNKYLKRLGYYFPIIPYSYEISTVGGIVATNAISAANDLLLKDYIEEIEIVDGSGKHYKTKDQELIGSFGQLAIITQVKLKIKKLEDYKINNKYKISTFQENKNKEKFDPNGVLC